MTRDRIGVYCREDSGTGNSSWLKGGNSSGNGMVNVITYTKKFRDKEEAAQQGEEPLELGKQEKGSQVCALESFR